MDTAAQANDTVFSIEALILVVILICYVTASHFLAYYKITYLHESVLCIILGIITAVIFRIALDKSIVFQDDLFFTLIIPPIVFASGYNLRKSLFFQNIGVISFLGIVGTLLGFVFLSAVIGFLNKVIFNGVLLASEVMILSSILCATDTVAAGSLVKVLHTFYSQFQSFQHQRFPLLHSVLFGQGIINDAVAIIIFRSVGQFNYGDQGVTPLEIFYIFLNFCYLFFFSILIGIFFGLGLSFALKINLSLTKYPIQQSGLLILVAYLSYLFSELINLSGILSLFTCSIIMGHYCYLNLSETSRKGTSNAFEMVSYLAEAFVFAYLGLCILGISINWHALGLALCIIITLPIARIFSVYLLPLIYAFRDGGSPLDSKQLKVCVYSGLIRGAVAFGLSFEVSSPNANSIKTIALLVVMISLFGGSILLNINTSKLLNSLDNQKKQISKEQNNRQRRDSSHSSMITAMSIKPMTDSYGHPSEIYGTETHHAFQATRISHENSFIQTRWDKFERLVILPYFTRIGSPETSHDSVQSPKCEPFPSVASVVSSSQAQGTEIKIEVKKEKVMDADNVDASIQVHIRDAEISILQVDKNYIAKTEPDRLRIHTENLEGGIFEDSNSDNAIASSPLIN